MPDTRSHRGAHPDDPELFAADQLDRLRRAVADLSYLRTRGYGEASASTLVGDRYALKRRQRTAVQRAACSDRSLERRRDRRVAPVRTAGPVAVDGFNLLITVEAALGSAYLIRGRDGCYRDLSGLHGTYRRVEETEAALTLTARHLSESSAEEVRWYLDRPVSNSKRAAGWIREAGRSTPEEWSVELVEHVDDVLAETDALVVTTDAPLLDRVDRWTDLTGRIVARSVPDAHTVDLSPE